MEIFLIVIGLKSLINFIGFRKVWVFCEIGVILFFLIIKVFRDKVIFIVIIIFYKDDVYVWSSILVYWWKL